MINIERYAIYLGERRIEMPALQEINQRGEAARFSVAGASPDTFFRKAHGNEPSFQELLTARVNDAELIAELQARNAASLPLPTAVDRKFRNADVASFAKNEYSSFEVSSISHFLAEKGTFDLHIISGYKVPIVGESEPQDIVIVSATPAETHGDMSNMVWIRDQNRVGKSLFEIWLYNKLLRNGNHDLEGQMAHDILLSTLHLMSTPDQIRRINEMIENPSLTDDYRNGPQIAIELNKLDSKEPTDWRHPQDAWQMLGNSIFDAIDFGLINVTELKEGNKQFLAAMMPLLAVIDFTNFENSGSWEEVRAVRSSVIGVETALLQRIKDHIGKPGFEFLEDGFGRMRDRLPEELKEKSVKEAADTLVKKGLHAIAEQLPFEAPRNPGTIKYREADVALLNLLDYDIPDLLVAYNIPIKAAGNQPMDRFSLEEMIINQVKRLKDDVTYGYRRYGVGDDPRDTYLGPGYNLNEILLLVNHNKRKLKEEAHGGQIDLDKKAELREEVVPEGEAAAWIHPASQLSAFAARKILLPLQGRRPGATVYGGVLSHEDLQRYKQIATEGFNDTMANITGNELQPVVTKKGFCEIKEVAPFQLPECRWRLVPHGGAESIVPSPNVPLNWTVGQTYEMVMLYALALQELESFVPEEHSQQKAFI